MKIVVLDGYTLNPGDLSWEELKRFGEVEVYDRTPREKIIERAKGAKIVLTNKTPLLEDELNSLADLKYIGVLATGYNVVDIEVARKRGIIVTNIPGYSTNSVVQMTFALILELCHHTMEHSIAVRDGAWSANKDFCFWNYPLIELDQKTLGIIGFGTIGKKVAKVAEAFGMKVLVYNHKNRSQSENEYYRLANLDEIFSMSDIVSLHCPLTPDTRGLVNKKMISKMKKSAFLINTSRGPVIVEEDLAEALNNNIIAGAGLDVLSKEPPQIDNPLLNAKNCIITPHIAWATIEARERLMKIAINNIEAYISGAPINIVNN